MHCLKTSPLPLHLRLPRRCPVPVSLLFIRYRWGGVSEDLALSISFAKAEMNVQAPGKKYPAVFLSETDVMDLCCCYIGAHKKVFCLKSKEDCTVFLKGGSHSVSRFTPSTNCLYVCKAVDKSSAWCDFSVETTKLEVLSLKDELKTEQGHSLDEWKVLFKLLKDHQSLPTSKECNDALKSVNTDNVMQLLKSPSKLLVIGWWCKIIYAEETSGIDEA